LNLAPEPRIIASTAIAVNANIVDGFALVGGCYHLTLFLFEYLRSEFGIAVDPVMGWANDGRDVVMIRPARMDPV
jgi:hypothetical protein